MIEDTLAESAIYLDIEEPSSQTTDSIGDGAASDLTVLEQRQELVFIDTDVENYQELLNDILAQDSEGRNIEVIVLDNERDGIEQISEALANYQNLDAVHLISHGSDGNIDIGNTLLDANTLNQNLAEISAWGDAFTEEGDFLIYGCNLAQTEEGQSLVQALSSLTHADVAASDDLTGNESLGGDWDLEYKVGNIESSVMVSTDTQQNWIGLMAVSVDSTSTGVGTSTNNVTFSHTTTAAGDRLMLVGVSMDANGGETVTSVNYGGQSLTLVVSRVGGSAPARIEIWQLVNPNAGTANVVVNLSGNADGVSIGATTFTGVDQTTALGTFVSDIGTSNAPTVNVSSVAGELVYDVVAGKDSGTLTQGAGQTELWDVDAGGQSRGASSIETGAATVTMSWAKGSSLEWSIGAVSIKAANDVPVATGNTVIASEDVPLLIGVSDFNFTDVESDALASVNITGLNLNGGALTHSAGAVTVTNGMTITAAQLADLTFTSALNDSTDSSFSYTVNDAGTGVTSAVMNITVNAVNDVPVATGNTVIASEDVPLVIGPSDFNFTDIESDTLTSVTITGLNLNGGTLTHSAGAVTVTNGMTITAAELADLTFTSALNDSTDSSFTYTVNDAGLGITSAMMGITVNAANDVPVNSVPGAQVTNEDTPLIFSTSGGNLIAISDVDAGSNDVEVTLTATNGTATLAFDSGPASASGTETRANTTTAGVQETNVESQQSVAIAANGNYVVTWTGTDANGKGVYARLYDASRTALTGELAINQTTALDQYHASVAMDDAGNFVVVWSTEGQNGDNNNDTNIYARRYDETGAALGGEFRVNSDLSKTSQEFASVAMDADGDFVVTWTGPGVGSGSEILAQRYDSFGVAQGGQFQINTTTANEQSTPAVDMTADGLFIVAWTGASGTVTEVYAQRYDVAGVALGGEFRANTTTTNVQDSARVAVDESGNFVIAWKSEFQDGDNGGDGNLYFQRYDANGTALGSETLVNTSTAGDQNSPTLSMDAAGNFVISWTSYGQDGDGGAEGNISLQAFDSSGAAVGIEVRINSTTSGDQYNSAMAMDLYGNYVVAWSGNGSGDVDGVFTQRYSNAHGLTFIAGDGVNDSTVTFTGTIADINAALDGLVFTPTPEFSGSASLQVVTDDQGNTGGAAETDDDTVNITVNAVNDAAVITGNTSFSGNEGDVVAGDLNATDVEGLTDTTYFTVSSAAANGTAVIDPNTGAWSFTPTDPNWFGSDNFTVTVTDDLGGTTNQIINITLSAINDVPVATGNTVIASEDVPLVIGASDFSFTDAELDSLASVTITGLNLNSGTLTHSAGAVTVTNGMTVTAAELADLTFTSAFNDSTDSSFIYTVNDAGLGVTSSIMNITVNAVNDVPVATGNTVIANEDVPLVTRQSRVLSDLT